jgi:two-component system, NtrC family, sensor histidine kinase KinB
MTPGVRKAGIDDSEVLDQIRSHWLSTVIHDFSSPLFAARGYIRMVLEERNGSLTEPQRRYMTAILENIGKLVTLAEELNDFPEKDAFEFDTISFQDLLQQAVAEVRSELTEKNVRLTEDVSGGSLSTIGDAEKLASAVSSFLSATVQFTGRSGSVQVYAREENEKIIVRFSATRDTGTATDEPLPDVSMPCKILRLHGGSAYISQPPGEDYLVTCELPVIRQFGC